MHRLRFAANLDVAEVGELEFVATAAEGIVGVAADQDAVLQTHSLTQTSVNRR